jgi:excisionase family DNA binding protein
MPAVVLSEAVPVINSANEPVAGQDEKESVRTLWRPRLEAASRRPLMTTVEAASLLGIPRIKLYRLVCRGEIPSCRVGKEYRFEREVVQAWMRAQTGC